MPDRAPTPTLARAKVPYALAAVAAVLAATAIAGWHRNTELAPPTVQVRTSHPESAGMDAAATYLPALFDEEERAAPIQPLPAQF